MSSPSTSSSSLIIFILFMWREHGPYYCCFIDGILFSSYSFLSRSLYRSFPLILFCVMPHGGMYLVIHYVRSTISTNCTHASHIYWVDLRTISFRSRIHKTFMCRERWNVFLLCYSWIQCSLSLSFAFIFDSFSCNEYFTPMKIQKMLVIQHRCKLEVNTGKTPSNIMFSPSFHSSYSVARTNIHDQLFVVKFYTSRRHYNHF